MISSLDLPGRLGQWPLGFPLLDLPGRSGSMALGLHVKRKLGRRPGHRSIWTVFVSGRIRHVSIFPSLVEICRIQTVWVSKISMESWIKRKRWSWNKIKKNKSQRKRRRRKRSKTITRTIVKVAGETSKGKPGIRPTHWSQLPKIFSLLSSGCNTC